MNEGTEDAHARIREKLATVSANVQAGVNDAQAASRLQQENSAAIRRLTVAVWVLSAILILHVGLTAVFVLPAFFSPGPLIPSSVRMAPSAGPSRMTGTETDPLSDWSAVRRDSEKFNGFSDWPPEKQIQASSVIAIARHEKEGTKIKAIISEIIKQDPKAKFYYKIGDEYTHGSRYVEDGVTYGDGQIIFFTGSPAMMRESMSFHGDRIGGLGDMPLELLRKLAKEAPSSGAVK